MDKVIKDLLDTYKVTKQTRDFLSKPLGMYIDGKFVSGNANETLDVMEPSTGKHLAQIARGNEQDINDAVSSAKQAFEGEWAAYKPRAREQVMRKISDLIRENLQTIAELECLDSGKAISGCKAVDIAGAANVWEYFAGWATKISGSTRDTSMPGEYFTYTQKEPVGVVGAIVPWNWPFAMATWKLAAPLAAGCTVVLKPAELTSLSMLYFMTLCEQAGLPKGVINIVTGKGSIVGTALSTHPDIAKVSFTGSTEVGKLIGKNIADDIKHVTLELGGKSPMIAFNDADTDALARATLGSIYFNAGQVCSAGSRLYVQRGVYDEVVEKIKKIAESIKLGTGLDPQTQMGPVISKAQQQSIMNYIEIGKKEGARLVTGGYALEQDGFFIKPTLFADTTNDMRIVQEEIFGPVLVMQVFDTEDEVVALANDNEFGLASSIWTQDVSRVHRMVPQIKAGNVWVNIHDPGDPNMAFGGVKHSGVGKDLGPEQLEHYLESKTVWINIGAKND
ncbi:MAG: aldehyde dehydrogenase family protein [Gammaproteobacteria bacterium]|nr:aldehyde dehydrogenase family protein [Gammaproteobacteria bacterium]